jgi:O-succinylbenzoate synthase
MAIELKSGQRINIKPGRVGGLTPAIQIHDAARAGDVACWVGAVPQSAVGFRTGVALAARKGFSYPTDYFDATRLFETDLAEPLDPVRDDSDGVLRIPLWTEPGLGVEPDPETLDKLCLARASV